MSTENRDIVSSKKKERELDIVIKERELEEKQSD
jgi:hypothetical protein